MTLESCYITHVPQVKPEQFMCVAGGAVGMGGLTQPAIVSTGISMNAMSQALRSEHCIAKRESMSFILSVS